MWLARCRENGWLEPHAAVLALEDEMRGIPLHQHAPPEGDECWKGHRSVWETPILKHQEQWYEKLARLLKIEDDDFWPTAFEIQGDVLMIKFEPHHLPYRHEIGQALLNHFRHVNAVCEDEGVHGEFRVRKLRILNSNKSSSSLETTIKEHGELIKVDPSKAYFSSRLSTERMRTREALMALRERIGKPLIIADPYAGVGPAFAPLLSTPSLVGGILASDLNPDAVLYLRHNLDRWRSKYPTPSDLTPFIVECKDARQWQHDQALCQRFNAILVNLPHESYDHLHDLIPLLDFTQPSLMRGWAIRPKAEMENEEHYLSTIFSNVPAPIESLQVVEVKGYSATMTYLSFDCWFGVETKQ